MQVFTIYMFPNCQSQSQRIIVELRCNWIWYGKYYL